MPIYHTFALGRASLIMGTGGLMRPSDTDYLPMFGSPVAGWHRWFAWRPVETVDYGMAWLRPVWRRNCHGKYTLPGPSRWFQYAVGGKNG